MENTVVNKNNRVVTRCGRCHKMGTMPVEDWSTGGKYTCKCGHENPGYLFLESFDGGFEPYRVATWESEAVGLVSNPKRHRNCMVGVDGDGHRHYFPVSSSKARTERTVNAYNYSGTRGISGEIGMTRQQVSTITDEQLRDYWKSSSVWHNKHNIHFI